jgi:hypothetical protein
LDEGKRALLTHHVNKRGKQTIEEATAHFLRCSQVGDRVLASVRADPSIDLDVGDFLDGPALKAALSVAPADLDRAVRAYYRDRKRDPTLDWKYYRPDDVSGYLRIFSAAGALLKAALRPD